MKRLRAHYLFGKTALPTDISSEIATILKELEHITDKVEFLRKAYDLVTSRYDAGRIKTFSRFWQLWGENIDDLVNRSGFMHCTNQNYILTNLLVKSGRFDEADITPKWTSVWYCTPHQYLRVKVGEKVYAIDCWGRDYGIKFGDHARGFRGNMRKVAK